MLPVIIFYQTEICTSINTYCCFLPFPKKQLPFWSIPDGYCRADMLCQYTFSCPLWILRDLPLCHITLLCLYIQFSVFSSVVTQSAKSLFSYLIFLCCMYTYLWNPFMHCHDHCVRSLNFPYTSLELWDSANANEAFPAVSLRPPNEANTIACSSRSLGNTYLLDKISS